MINSFRFVSYNFDVETSTMHMNYAFDDEYYMEEKIVFHMAKKSFKKEEILAINQIGFFLHLACGISYYKAFLPPMIKIETGKLNFEQAKFFEEFYLKGLGEFAFRNKLSLVDKIKFPYENIASFEKSSNIGLLSRIAIPVGGGKDSNVVIEILKRSSENLIAIAQGRPRPIAESIAVSALPDINFTRTISPKLIEINSRENVYNGHVPISGIYAFCLALAAVLYGYDKVAMGNERSANVGNVTLDFEVNHQWSKSIEFEELFGEFNKSYMLKNFTYFSLLRPLSELDIARRFACLEQYHRVFTSCNKAFKIDREKRLDRWCGDCDKCRFVFLALAPFMNKNSLIEAVGHNLLDDETQSVGFAELFGLDNHKPFECVGEMEECCVALYLLSQKDEWRNDYIVKHFYPLIIDKYGVDKLKKWEKEVFTPTNKHHIPDNLKDFVVCY